MIDDDSIDIDLYTGKTAHELIGLLPEPPTTGVDDAIDKSQASPCVPDQQGSTSVDRDEMTDLLLRATRNVIHAQDRSRLYAYMCTLSPPNMERFCRQGLTNYKESFELSSTGKLFGLKYSKTGSAKINELHVSKNMLEFGYGGRPCPVDEEMAEAVVVKCLKGKAKYTVQMPPACTDYQIDISHKTGYLKVPSQVDKMKGKTVATTETLRIKLTLKTSKPMNVVISVAVEDGPFQFIAIALKPGPSAFGAPLTSFPIVNDNGHRVPALLQVLRLHLERGDGFGTPALFRSPGDVDEMVTVKRLLTDGRTELGSVRVHTLANVIKLFFAALPVPVLSAIPEGILLSIASTESCITAFDKYITGLERAAGLWLLDLLVHVAANETNKVSMTALSHLMGPTLFDPLEGGSAEQVMLVNQQRVKALNILMEWRLPECER